MGPFKYYHDSDSGTLRADRRYNNGAVPAYWKDGIIAAGGIGFLQPLLLTGAGSHKEKGDSR